jgi:hypothetical protein
MKIGQPGREKAQEGSFRGGGWAGEALSGFIGFSRGFSLKVVVSRAFRAYAPYPRFVMGLSLRISEIQKWSLTNGA